MPGTSQLRQMLVVILISLFMIINVSSSTTREFNGGEQASETRTTSDLIHVSGTMGTNGWYISYVQITIHPPQGAGPVFYKFDNGTWSEYTVPLVVETDGSHTVYVFYMIDGNQSEVYSVSFKVDKTPPVVHLNVTRINLFHYAVLLDGYDNTSGISCFQIYFDDSLIGVVTPPEPFEFEVDILWGANKTIEIIAYDMAGNSAGASHTFPYDLSYFHQSLLQHLMRGLQNLILLYQLLIGMINVSR